MCLPSSRISFILNVQALPCRVQKEGSILMNAATYNTWDKIKRLAKTGVSTYHCSSVDEVRCINELVNAGYITVSWKTSQDAAFCIAEEEK